MEIRVDHLGVVSSELVSNLRRLAKKHSADD